MTRIINISFNKYPMSWELIHRNILRPSDSVMRVMCHHQTLNGLTKHCPRKLNNTPCTICYTEKLQLSPKEQQLTQINFNQENLCVTFICEFASMITLVCANTRMIRVFPTVSKQDPFSIIRFILKKIKSLRPPIQTYKS